MDNKKEQYEEYISERAFMEADDGEHGLGIAQRASNLKSKLSFEDYKNGIRLKK